MTATGGKGGSRGLRASAYPDRDEPSPRARERTPLLAELLTFLVLTTIERTVAVRPSAI